MAQKPVMQRFAKWHIWIGWIAGLPVLLWMVTGLFMAARPIEEVRGEHLRNEVDEQPLIIPGSALATAEFPLKEMRAVMQDGRAIAILTAMDGSVRRVDMASGQPIAPVDASGAREIAAERIKGGDKAASVRLFEADEVPFDFRRPVPVWQVALEDGTHVYIGRDTGDVEAVRTRWWRGFDFMWGLHILDPIEREDTSHPVLIIAAILGTIAALLGCVLLFRRRKARISTP